MKNHGLNTADFRWTRTLHSQDTFGDDLGSVGASVGPRTGPNKRSKGDKEDYVLRRLIAAWRLSDQLRFPVDVRAERDRDHWPDFVLAWPDGQTLGVEVTEAGEEKYQRWLTETEDRSEPEGVVHVPYDASTSRTVDELIRAIDKKVQKYDRGSYRGPAACHLIVYDNTSWGGFLDKAELIEGVRARSNLAGRFNQVHLVFGECVVLDIWGDMKSVDVSQAYEIDYPRWISTQVENLRELSAGKVDTKNIAGELQDLGKTERRALASHIRNLLLHLVKYEFRRKKRGTSWKASIDNARAEIEDILTESPSLRQEFAGQISRQYSRARQQATAETGLQPESFPESCPYSPEQLLDDEYLPGET